MDQLYLDLETFSTLNLPTVGTHKYAEESHILMWQYAINDGEVIVLDYDNPKVEDLKTLLNDPRYEIVIHNSHFDRTILRHAAHIDIPVSRIFDTMACAMAHSLPGSLGQLCEVFHVPIDKAKDKQGTKLIQLFCKVQRRKGVDDQVFTRNTHPTEWAQFRDYGRNDIEAMRELYKRLPRWNFIGSERAVWELDQKINDRGVAMDIDLAQGAIRATKEAKISADQRTVELTEGKLSTTNQRNALLSYLEDKHGLHLEDLTSANLKKISQRRDIDENILALLTARLETSKTSVAKYQRVIKTVSKDGRLRGILQFCGGRRTGRWAGRLFQPQNLPQSSLTPRELELFIQEIKQNAEGLI